MYRKGTTYFYAVPVGATFKTTLKEHRYIIFKKTRDVKFSELSTSNESPPYNCIDIKTGDKYALGLLTRCKID